jgi:uncharacterized protein (DUF934 family)
MQKSPLEIFLASAPPVDKVGNVLRLPNDTHPLSLKDEIQAAECVELEFPKFTDGRAFSQAYLLRSRLRYGGHIRAVGEVLIDQLLQMQRTGFSQAILRADQDADHAQKLLAHYKDFYQGDVYHPPRFLRPRHG